ncbi:putative mitogen-activated protein kinase kinase kinase STE-STE11 family [Helianthus anomalus]
MHPPPMEEWVRCQAIGQGSSANVSLAKPANHTSRFPPLIVVKSCHVATSTSLKNEFTILNELKGCPEIVECYGECFTLENSERLYNVVLEYACGGSLADKVKSSENLRLSESVVRRYTKSILKGLQFIHRRGFVHCDIKLQNVLVFSGDNVKIADFGLAKKADAAAAAEGFDTKYEVRGTPLYMSPETVSGREQGPAADVWAVGCVVSEMIAGKPAWRCTDIGTLLMKIGSGDDIPVIPGKLSDVGKDFLGKCFEKDASKRWTAEMLLNHPFMDGEDEFPSNSPRNPFDFPEWESERWDMVPVTTTKSFCSPELESWTGVEACVSAASRLQQLVVEERPDWFFTSSWITVREPQFS